jgi:hypothetical protein
MREHKLNNRWRSRAALALGAVALTAVATGCGTTRLQTKASADSATPTAFKTPGASPLLYPPITDAALRRGSASHQVAETILAFYRAAWQDDPSNACARFSPKGLAGFMRAAGTAFPQAVTKQSTCEHAMEIYNAALGDSASTTQENDPSFTTAALDNVGATAIHVSGNTATAIAPTNVVDLINPERFYLSRTGSEWRIDGSASLNRSNLPKILAHAKSAGELRKPR